MRVEGRGSRSPSRFTLHVSRFHPCSPADSKTGYFILEGLNSFATVYYFYYFYFFMQTTFGFGNKANLALAALNGAVYAVMAWQGGKFAQRFGYFTALKVGFVIMMAALAVGSQLHSASRAYPRHGRDGGRACVSPGRRSKRSSAKGKPARASSAWWGSIT